MLGTSRPSESILAQESRQHLHLILAFEEMGGVDGRQPDQFGTHPERVLDSRRRSVNWRRGSWRGCTAGWSTRRGIWK